MTPLNIAVVFAGGGAGSVARYVMMNVINRFLPNPSLPWPTLGVNVMGALMIGVLLEVLALRLSLPAASRFLLVTGFLGGFTTFSAFSLEGALMLERGDYMYLAAYIALSVGGTIAAVFVGSGLVRAFS